ncbi:hypothetical protein [Gymnodinialimonas hymeniacidonis]|uniref:hypothetical protein n=1 Tax=Gymnodinialimonas hymeniacidonis TaxID=3126508 RepID=UPI0034C65F6A
MSLLLTPAEAALYRTGPNNISILFEAKGGFDPARALFGLHQMVEGTERFHRIPKGRLSPCFGARLPLHWPDHVAILDATDVTAAQMMALTRRLALPSDRPLWRAVLVNPDGAGWRGLALHFDHAIADGTRISRHIVKEARPGAEQKAPIVDLPRIKLAQLETDTDPRLTPADPALLRLSFADLSRAMPDAASHSDALLRLAHRILSEEPAFAGLPTTRRDHAQVARIEALRTAGGVLGNRAHMVTVDLSVSATASSALFERSRASWVEAARMNLARFVPAALLRPIVQKEFSQPGIVLTVVPVGRTLPPLFGLDLQAIHPAAPVLGRPPLAITAVRTGQGFDICITAHGPDGRAIPDLSQRVASQMTEIVQ